MPSSYATAPSAPLDACPLASLVDQLALPSAALAALHLRFEPVARLAAARGPRQVGVFVSCAAGQLHSGNVQALVVCPPAAAQALQRACVARGLRFVDNT